MVELYTLGTFSLIIDGTVISDGAGRTGKMWKLLNLLVANRGAPLSVARITESIWPEGEIENGSKSLHNLVFRLRKILKQTANGELAIHYHHNSYAFHMEDGLYVDAYEFEDNCLEAKRLVEAPEASDALLERTLSLYKGSYLMDSYDEAWALTQTGRYRRMYIEAVVALADSYMRQRRYEDAARVCERAIGLEPLEEIVYERLIRALQRGGQKMQAICVCENLFALLYRELGVGAGDSIQALYRELKENVIQTRHNVGSILRSLAETEEEKTAYACGMETFKGIYRYEVRQSIRRRESIFLALLSITDHNRNIPAAHVLNRAKPCLLESCLSVLRRGDVVSNYSSSQLVVLLAGFAHENGGVVLNRIRKRFAQLYPARDVVIEFETRPMRVNVLVEGLLPNTDLAGSPPVHSPRTTRRHIGSVL